MEPPPHRDSPRLGGDDVRLKQAIEAAQKRLVGGGEGNGIGPPCAGPPCAHAKELAHEELELALLPEKPTLQRGGSGLYHAATGAMGGIVAKTSGVTRSVARGTKGLLTRIGAERAANTVALGRAGQYSGMALVDHTLARLGYVSKTLGFVDNFAAWLGGEHEVSIAYPDVSRSQTDDSEEIDRNYLLQKAIRLFMERAYSFESDSMCLSLVPAEKVSQEGPEDGSGGFGGAYQQLKGFQVSGIPNSGTWVEIDAENRLWFQMEALQKPSGLDDKGHPVMLDVVVYRLKCYGADSRPTISAFVAAAWSWYLEQRKTETDRARYFLQARVNPKAESVQDAAKMGKKNLNIKEIDKAPFQFKKYLLRDEKTFESLFFAAKPQLLQLCDDFMHKRGKFAIKGFPQKLGLLLYGPPGTGKTSIIKALGAYTGRHVISINLRQISTNQELFDLFFDLVFHTIGEEMPLRFRFEDVIFVMEEVDRAGNLVRGTRERAAEVMGGAEAGGPAAAGKARPASEGLNGGKEGGHREVSVKEQLEKVLAMEEALQSGHVPPELKDLVESCKKGLAEESTKSAKDELEAKDRVDLQGLLQVFDGVVDSPGRIIIMTTNVDPAAFDPALIRPGRINWCMLLGYMKEAHVLVEMIQHYMLVTPELPEQEELSQCLARYDFTPAAVEQLCVEVSSVGELIVRMQGRMGQAEAEATAEAAAAKG